MGQEWGLMLQHFSSLVHSVVFGTLDSCSVAYSITLRKKSRFGMNARREVVKLNLKDFCIAYFLANC